MADTPHTSRSPFSLRRGLALHDKDVKQFTQAYREKYDQAVKCHGLNLLHSMSLEEATDFLWQAGYETRDAIEYYNRGCVSAKREDFGKAIDNFRRAAELDSSLLDAIHNLAVCYERTKQFPQAISTWQTYLDSLRDARDADRAKVIKDRIAQLKTAQRA